MADTILAVDLKWSLWSLERDVWNERAPGAWERMEEAFTTGPPVKVETAPGKEIRFGYALISPGSFRLDFYTEWDNGRQIHITDASGCPRDFAQLMHWIDHCEVDLLRKDHQEDRGCKARRLETIRCHDCGYPYHNKTSKRIKP